MALSFPMNGYHGNFESCNTHSIFELVEKDKMYVNSIPRELSESAKRLIYDELRSLSAPVNLRVDYITFIDDNVPAPFGWMGLATKKDGLEYQGSFIKRFSSWAWKVHNYRLPMEFASKVGSVIGKDSKSSDTTHYLRFDPLAQYVAGEFGDKESCFWNGRQGARVLIRNNGGSFVEFYSNESAYIKHGIVLDGKGIARCWLLPINQFLPYEFQKDFAFVVCNFYSGDGDYNSFNMARSVAGVLGLPYTKVSVVSNLDVLWINSNSGFLISDNPKLLSSIKRIDMNYNTEDYDDADDPVLDSLESHECSNCGNMVTNDDWYDRWELCSDCYNKRFKYCDGGCGRHLDTENETANDFMYNDNEDKYFCRTCAEEMGFHYCRDCHSWKSEGQILPDSMQWGFGTWICSDCYTKNYAHCSKCGKFFKRYDASNDTSEIHNLCRPCREEKHYIYIRCPHCFEAVWVKKHRVRATHEARVTCPNCGAVTKICSRVGCTSLMVADSAGVYCNSHRYMEHA